MIESNLAELAILYEISSCTFPRCPEDLFWEIVEKTGRAFGVERVVFFLREKEELTRRAWGFDIRTPPDYEKYVSERSSSPSSFTRSYATRRGLEVLLYLEKGKGFAPCELRLLEIFWKRLAEALQAQKREEEIFRANERFRLLIENTPMVAVFGFDRAGHLLHWNEEARELFGFEKAPPAGKPGEILSLFFETPEIQEMVAETWETGRPTLPREVGLRDREGREKWAIFTLVPVTREARVEEIFCMAIDITQRKEIEEELRHLNVTDALTGLYNRHFFERELRRLDEEKIRPVAVIICDVDCLKLVNDTFGHSRGDEVLRQVAALLRRSFRASDVIARIGGDEFAVILPGVSRAGAEEALNRLFRAVAAHNAACPPGILSISAGLGFSHEARQSVYEASREADDAMYNQKFQQRSKVQESFVSSLVAFAKEQEEILGSSVARLKELSRKFGEKLGFRPQFLAHLDLLAEVHDLGIVGLSPEVLFKPCRLDEKEWEEIRRHPEKGYRIARLSSRLAPVAELILQHHERWDGQGYPRGLKGEEIHPCARAFAIVDAYEAMTSSRPYRDPLPPAVALQELEKEAGAAFDPRFVAAFRELISTSER